MLWWGWCRATRRGQVSTTCLPPSMYGAVNRWKACMARLGGGDPPTRHPPERRAQARTGGANTIRHMEVWRAEGRTKGDVGESNKK